MNANELTKLAERVEALSAFLGGTGPMPGEDVSLFFGDPHPTKRGAFWWRNSLPALDKAAAALRARAAMEVPR